METTIRGQSNERGKIPDFETIAVEDIKKKLEIANDHNKFAYVADLSGKLDTYFIYSGHHYFDL